MPYFDVSFKSVSQIVDDALNSPMEAEAKISEAAESFERAINVTSDLKDSSFGHPVANRKADSAVTKEMVRASTNDMSVVLVADAPKENMYPKVGVYYCCTFYG